MAEAECVVTISRLPGGGRYACVGGIRLVGLDHGGPVQEVVILAPGPVHGAGLGPSSAVAVADYPAMSFFLCMLT